MIQSMTGYGKAESSSLNKVITVDIRALNSKQCDINLRLPNAFRSLDVEIRNMIQKELSRGKIDVNLNYVNRLTKPSVILNKELAKAYYEELKSFISEVGEDEKVSLTPIVLKMPEVMVQEKEEVDESETKAVLEAAKEAISQLISFRTREGEFLRNDFVQRLDSIMVRRSRIMELIAERSESVKNKLLDAFKNNPGIEADNNRLEQELIYYLEKLDINEELVRLEAHCHHFSEVIKETGTGKKMGFIAQEIGREINTIGSKANHSEIQRIVVEMKENLEGIREQVLNVL